MYNIIDDLYCRAQAGKYEMAKTFAERGKKIEEEELGKRPEEMSEVLHLMAYVADEVGEIILYVFDCISALGLFVGSHLNMKCR